jgi:hypothetical protein
LQRIDSGASRPKNISPSHCLTGKLFLKRRFTRDLDQTDPLHSGNPANLSQFDANCFEKSFPGARRLQWFNQAASKIPSVRTRGETGMRRAHSKFERESESRYDGFGFVLVIVSAISVITTALYGLSIALQGGFISTP